ncbi:MAG: hypothetical protein AAF950_17745 [Pseudomonadota bacterium]
MHLSDLGDRELRIHCLHQPVELHYGRYLEYSSVVTRGCTYGQSVTAAELVHELGDIEFSSLYDISSLMHCPKCGHSVGIYSANTERDGWIEFSLEQQPKADLIDRLDFLTLLVVPGIPIAGITFGMIYIFLFEGGLGRLLNSIF